MIRISSLKINIKHTDKELINKICKELKVNSTDIISYEIHKKSIDARKKNDIVYVYALDVELKKEDYVLKQNLKNNNIKKMDDIEYRLPDTSPDCEYLYERPVIVGFGPAGIFCALSLARKGFNPIVIERGEDVDKRTQTVDLFWNNGKLNHDSNVSFGEGGAGTFSDGKLNTLVKDISGRNKEVLKTFVNFGADKEILYLQKAHIGTDVLKGIIKNIRNEIISLGGEIRFSTRLDDINIEKNNLYSIKLSNAEVLKTSILVLAIGHSARDTFYMLHKNNIFMSAKSFAVGLRVMHSQRMIDLSQFGESYADYLSPASYKLADRTSDDRGVYSFCMCPGGFVVNASSQDKKLCINGMSYHARDSKIANSAIIVTVNEDDFKKEAGDFDILSGLKFQESLEKKAFDICNGKIPVQLLKDFIDNKTSDRYYDILPCIKGEYEFADLNNILPAFISDGIKEGMIKFDKKIKGFAKEDTILAGVETRTSSPIRIDRNENFEANIKGIYPCGEGAGYAGGITSAAMDGLKVSEAIIKKYKCMY